MEREMPLEKQLTKPYVKYQMLVSSGSLKSVIHWSSSTVAIRGYNFGIVEFIDKLRGIDTEIFCLLFQRYNTRAIFFIQIDSLRSTVILPAETPKRVISAKILVYRCVYT